MGLIDGFEILGTDGACSWASTLAVQHCLHFAGFPCLAFFNWDFEKDRFPGSSKPQPWDGENMRERQNQEGQM